jgi:hypothetical protein
MAALIERHDAESRAEPRDRRLPLRGRAGEAVQEQNSRPGAAFPERQRRAGDRDPPGHARACTSSMIRP